jgi:glycolate oxidase iron-sulfur subunit
MVRAIEACVHCGFCLPTCPTYITMGEEMDSPRGRIFLMKEVLEGRMDPGMAEPFIDNCLGCQACVTSCPSGVQYGELITPYRAWTEPGRNRGFLDRFRRRLLLFTLPHPGRFRTSITVGRWIRPLRRGLPKILAGMLEMVPVGRERSEGLREVYPAIGRRKARVGLLAGCAQQVLSPGINRAAIRVLNRNGVEVVVPATQACCGALAMHIGAEKEARATARRNLAAFPDDLDAVITTAAGCGSGMKEYGLLFRDEPDENNAKVLAEKTQDICAFLDFIGFTPPEDAVGEGQIVAYHDACHLAHAQGVRDAPRRLLETIPGLTLRNPTESEICCGSAGTYNIEHPDTARILGRRKAQNLTATGAEVIATGNIGCLVQIAKHLAETGVPAPVRHTIELLDSKTGSLTK